MTDTKMNDKPINAMCVWHEDDPDSLPQYWTDCGASFDFNEDGLTENGFKFCYSCGKPITEEKFTPPTEATNES